MTNSEYFEKNNVSFAKAMEIFNRQKRFKKGGTNSFDKFLASERTEPKFKIGDLIVLQLNETTRDYYGWKHNVVFEVIDIVAEHYEAKYLTPSSPTEMNIGAVREFHIDFIDKNCVLY